MTNDTVNREFRQFGDRMFYILIFFLLNFIIPVIPGILMLIYSFQALGDIKKANKELKSDDLEDFRSYFISSYVLIFITGTIIIIAGILFAMAFWPYIASQTFPPLDDLLRLILIPGIIFVIGLVMLLIAGILRYSAWKNLNEFFIKNSEMFPEAIANDARKGSENLKTASLCMLLGFLIITILISIIYEIIGYAKLSKLKNLPYSSVNKPSQPIETPNSKTGGTTNFCPQCGAKKEEDATFCSSCGQQF
ncbi:MAG: zinc ribbon domain-containing protein [Candidatus Lokiarchaeota archaeon]|nr:zinc ribbon domain-containing protein [Candidatus Lokiarchaeota archaeon]